MEYAVLSNHETIAHGETDNAYQVRNLLLQHLENEDYDFEDDNTINTRTNLKVKCNANLHRLLQPTPQIEINKSITFTQPKPQQPQRLPKQPDPNLVSLNEICKEIRMRPIAARRILRKSRGALNQRYEWPRDQVAEIKKILTRK